ncbi:aldehyde dehydrogenase family protein [Rhodococcus sp. NPDC057529]|uniref:aldehyde dehydrogenase family protein n=1 Tax=Rhodococcus sp. NPDC057529 TaxID=3346158 RepID=UPI0036709093
MTATEQDSRLHAPIAQTDLIDGTFTEPTEVLTGTLDDPNTGVVRQRQVATAGRDVERALAAAAAVHADGTWARSPTDLRIRLLDALADGLADRADEVARQDCLSTGNPLRVSSQMASYLAPRVHAARDQLLEIGESSTLAADGREVRLLRRPLGPAVVLAPWNAPTFVAVAKVASALAAGCPVILKPSEWAPAGCQIVAEILAQAIADLELPAAVFQLVHGGSAVGAQLVSDPRIRAISFTGGGAGGRAVAQAAAPYFTALQLELGGHNPAVVRPDADIAAAAAAVAEGMTKLNGQWCEAPGKILVPDELHDEFVDALLGALSALRVGHSFDAGTDVGPLSHQAHRARLQGQIDDLVSRGGKVLTSAPLPELEGWFFSPTVVVGLPAEQSEHELFGPAVTVHAVESVEDAIRAANGPETGLAGFVFGRDLEAALDTASQLSAGEIRVNGCKLADLADGSEQSFWNSAGIGGHGPTDMVRFFQGRRTIGVDDPALPL